jgi:cysteine-rich repeat protein
MTELTTNISRIKFSDSKLRMLIVAIIALFMVAMGGCYGNIGSSSGSGQLKLDLQIARGINITEINYQVTRPGMDPLIGTFPVTDDLSVVVSGIISGLSAGTGYTITLTANTDDITCVGSAMFDVVADAITQVNVPVQCRATRPSNTVCGNGIIEPPNEECDDGNNLSGDGCSSTCIIDQPLPKCGDGILDPGEECDDNNTIDDDGCSADCKIEPICGNGLVEEGETCDKGILAGKDGACPTSCDDGKACTKDSMTGSVNDCDVVCSHQAIDECKGGDGCCSAGCNILSDSYCPPTCGDGIVSPPDETCDNAILAGQSGACPANCDDGENCTKDSATGSIEKCNITCSHETIINCISGDGCCPKGCTIANDDDCTAKCGDGVLTPPETCDYAIHAGEAGACPADCNDGNACTTDSMAGSAAKCNVTCHHQTILKCQSGDGCCAAGCNNNNDSECSPVCGNGVVEAGEQCDDGNRVGGDACSAKCTIESICEAPSTKCLQCECHKCGSAMNTCFNGSGVATHGPAAGTPKSKLCADLVQCVQKSGCVGPECLCGNTSFCKCMHGQGNGPCKAQVMAAAETSDPFLISLRGFCPFYAVGRAAAVEVCAFWECYYQCIQ